MSEHDIIYYFKCFIGGALACGLTNTFLLPLEILRGRALVDPEKYPSLRARILKTLATEGAKSLTIGWLPTLIGYSLQGMAKFGFYEIYKDFYAEIEGDKAYKHRTIVYALASASAEAIANVFLCPFEVCRIRMFTSRTGTFPTEFGKAWNTIYAVEGWNGLYRSLPNLWLQQIPYNIVNFVAFERIVEAFYRYIFTKPKDQYDRTQKLSITFASGFIAGALYRLCLHALILQTTGKALRSGLGLRIVVTGTFIGFQWLIYDSFKTAVGLQIAHGLNQK